VSTATAGYITDVEYTGQFYGALAPARLAYIAAINGYAPPDLQRPFSYCEIGCGKGVTSLVLAATHPSGVFHAFDINCAHVEYAERLRDAARLSNLRLHAAGVAEMLDQPLPDFDFVVLHGLYSWVPEAVRAQIREFLRRKLKPGGLAMVSYNAMPGWAHLQPIRRMVQAYAASLPGDSLTRASAAFAYVKHLAEQGAAYFRLLPAAAAHLTALEQEDIRYIAHEYLTPHGDPFYFADVEAAMRSAGLTFAGSMSPADNYRELMAPEQFQKLLATAPTRAVLETHRDFIVNAAFRQDLYAARPPAESAGDTTVERLEGIEFCLTDLPERLPLQRTQGALQYDLSGPGESVQALHRVLAGGPASASALRAALPAAARGQAAALIQQLVVSQHIAPCPPARPSPGWLALNSALVQAALRDKLVQLPLACPRTGSAMTAEPVHAASIEAGLRSADAKTAAADVLRTLRSHAHPVKRTIAAGEQQPASDADVLEYVCATWRALRDPVNPDTRLLRQFGVLS
jgi:SAM-dependent methyltransferase